MILTAKAHEARATEWWLVGVALVFVTVIAAFGVLAVQNVDSTVGKLLSAPVVAQQK